jgi:hypothetical protein
MQNTDLSLQPYFDDFTEDKKFYKVLFKPNYPVQARELTTLQSMLQYQIEKFGQHVFKEGSVVIPGQTGYNTQYNAVLVQPTVNSISFETIRQNLTEKTIRGLTSNVVATVVNSISAQQSEKLTPTLYIKYISSGNIVNGTQFTKFANGETLVDEFNNPVAVTVSQNATDYVGSAAYITEGVYFIRGFFVTVPQQTIILDQYSNFPSYKIGLSVQESIVTAETDSSLYDNAVGSSNYTAPGADRLKIDAVLTKQDINFGSDSSFIELLRLDKGKLVEQVQASVYDELEKNLARRTYDESGNYTINDINLKIRETYNDGKNNGVYKLNDTLSDGRKVLNRQPTAEDGNAINGLDYYTIELDPLKAYVKGYEINNTSKKYLTVEKPRSSLSLNNQGISSIFGNYFTLKVSTITGGVIPTGTTIQLLNSGTQIGQCRSLSLISGGRLFVCDVSMFSVITTSEATPNVIVGDFIFGSNGSQGVVHGVNGNVITVRQTTGDFSAGVSFTNSNNSSTHIVATAVNNKIENITSILASGGATAQLELEQVSISGSSFVVTTNVLTGTSTQFSRDLKAGMKLQIGTNIATIQSISGESVTLSTGSIANGTYYSVKKLVPKLNTFGANFFSRFPNTVKSTSDLSYYKTINETKTVSNGAGGLGSVTISTTSDYAISTADISVSNSSGSVSYTISSSSQPSSINLVVSSSLINTSVLVTYKVKVNNPTLKTKTSNKFSCLLVDKQQNSTNTKYGTRISDKEISLKFSDVYQIHAIHEAISSSDANTNLFDSVVVNDSSLLQLGDIIYYESVSARIISISGNTLYIKYLSSDKFPTTFSQALQIVIAGDSNIQGKFITSVSNGTYRDITNNFNLVKNDSTEFYNISKLVRNEGRPVPTNKFIVIFDYYIHSNTSNDFYTANSYNFSEEPFATIPTTYDGIPYTDIVDFRYETTASSVAGTSGTLTSPFVETNSAFDLFSSTSLANRVVSTFTYPGELISADYDYYLGRIDKIFIDENNNLLALKGSESNSPQEPQEIQNSLLLATVTIPPYMKDVSLAGIKISQQKRYTMKDISSIDRRLETVENLTSLNLLEVGTNSLLILDEFGNNRFKTGFVADNFKTTDFADLNNVRYTASIDTENAILRPYPYATKLGVNYDSTSTTTKTGSIVTLPYTETEYIKQQYASRVENLQPFEVISWNGEITLQPNKDVWFDTVRTETNTQQIDLTTPFRALFDRTTALADQWNTWNTTIAPRLQVAGGTLAASNTGSVDNTFTTFTQDIEVGDSINSIEVNRFVRSRLVYLKASKLKANTVMHFFVDEVLHDEMIFPLDMTGMTERTGAFVVGEKVFLSNTSTVTSPPASSTIEATVVESSLGNYTSSSTYLSIDPPTTSDRTQLNPTLLNSTYYVIGETSKAVGKVTLVNSARVKTDAFGNLLTFLIIKPDTFETGNLSFKVCDQITGTSIYGISETSAVTTYDTLGTTVNLTSNVMSLDLPNISSGPIRGTTVTFIPFPPPPPPAGGGDPVAQSFYVDSQGGVFLSSIDLYFQSKDSTTPVSIEIRTMENGTLTSTVVPNSVAVVQASDVKISSDASLATKFTFPSLVYLNQDTYYAFMVRSDSKLYKIWISRLNGTDVTTSYAIDKQPYSGSLFKSQNMSTWTPDQFEDVKFTINRAKFATNSTYTCVLNNDPISDAYLIQSPLKLTSNSSVIEVFQPNHCMNTNQNYVKLSGITSDAPPTVLTSSGGITITYIGNISVGNASSATWQTINGSPVSESNPGYVMIDNEIMKYTLVSGNTLRISERGLAGTTATAHSSNSPVMCYNLNGIPLIEINRVHKITEVIDFDNYKISTASKASSNLRSGGDTAKASRNIQYEELYPNLNNLVLPSTDMTVTFSSISGSSLYGPANSFAQLNEESIENKQYSKMNSSRLIASAQNTAVYYPGYPYTLKLNVKMSSELDNVSPLLELYGSSLTTVSNRLSKKVIDNVIDVSAELTPSSGFYSSYITKKVTLQGVSTSIKVFFDAVRTQGLNGTYSDIKVFVRTVGDGNLGSFNEAGYVEVPAVSYPTSSNFNDYKAFEFELKNLSEFKQYAIKVCMIGDDQTNNIKIRNLRAISLAV